LAQASLLTRAVAAPSVRRRAAPMAWQPPPQPPAQGYVAATGSEAGMLNQHTPATDYGGSGLAASPAEQQQVGVAQPAIVQAMFEQLGLGQFGSLQQAMVPVAPVQDPQAQADMQASALALLHPGLAGGNIKHYDSTKGFGFIDCEGVEGDVLFERTELPEELQRENADFLRARPVSFELSAGPDGRARAIAVQLLPCEGRPLVGTIRSFVEQQGYGSIECSCLTQEVRFERKDVPMQYQGHQLLGASVYFHVEILGDGKMRAQHLELRCLAEDGRRPFTDSVDAAAAQLALPPAQLEEQPLAVVPAPAVAPDDTILTLQGVIRLYDPVNVTGTIQAPGLPRDVRFRERLDVRGGTLVAGQPVSFALHPPGDFASAEAVGVRLLNPPPDLPAAPWEATAAPAVQAADAPRRVYGNAGPLNAEGRPSLLVDGAMLEGTVKLYQADKGFGFLNVGGEMADLYFQRRDLDMDWQLKLSQGETVPKGITLAFKLEVLSDGRYQAHEVHTPEHVQAEVGGRIASAITELARQPQERLKPLVDQLASQITQLVPQPQQSFPQSPPGQVRKGYCYDFAKGLCARADLCQYKHELPPPKEAEVGYCFDYAAGKCTRGLECKFQHALDPARKAKAPFEAKVPFGYCFDFSEGRCTRADECRYRHELPDQLPTQVPQLALQGNPTQVPQQAPQQAPVLKKKKIVLPALPPAQMLNAQRPPATNTKIGANVLLDGAELLGKCKYFKTDQGYGFLNVPGVEQDIYFKTEDMLPELKTRAEAGGANLAGEPLHFWIERLPDGRWRGRTVSSVRPYDAGAGAAAPSSAGQATGPTPKRGGSAASLEASVPPPDGGLVPVTDLYFDGAHLVGNIKKFMGTIEEGHGYIAVPGQMTDLLFGAVDLGPDVRERARLGYPIVDTSVQFRVRRANQGPFRAKEISFHEPQLEASDFNDASGAAPASAAGPQAWPPAGDLGTASGSDKLLDGAVMAGVVKTYSDRTGYGSICVTQDPSAEIFFQTSDLGNSLQMQLQQNVNIVGGMVLFCLERGPTGCWHARSIAIPLDFASPVGEKRPNDAPVAPPPKQQRLDDGQRAPGGPPAEVDDGPPPLDMEAWRG